MSSHIKESISENVGKKSITKQQPVKPYVALPSLEFKLTSVDQKSLSHNNVKQLQRIIGNRRVSKLLGHTPPTQTKLTVGPVGDKYEQEADQVAENVVEQSNPPSRQPAQRQESEEEELLQGRFETAHRQEFEEDELLQEKFANPELPTHFGQENNRTGMPENLKAGIENLSGISMDNVKVHYNSSQPAQLNALAYTQGMDIHVGPGQEQSLPHEAWHVVQQKQGRVKPTIQARGVTINDDEGLEREADVMGARALQTRHADQITSDSADQAATKKRREAPESSSAAIGTYGRILNLQSTRRPIQPQWDFTNPDLTSTREIRPLDDRGIALLFEDDTGDHMVVKLTENPPALERMVSSVYGEIGGFDVLATADLTGQIAALGNLIRDPRISKGDGWQQVARAMMPNLNLRGFAWKRQILDWVAGNLGVAPRSYVQGMPFATGTETAKLAKGAGHPQGNRIKQLFRMMPYMVQLGRLAAFDIFLLNGDRVLAGNLGNWFTDVPNTSVASLIDNADQHTRNLWIQGNAVTIGLGGHMQVDLPSLADGNIDATARAIGRNLANGARIEGAFADNAQRDVWLNAAFPPHGTNWDFMAQSLALGMRAGKTEIVDKLTTRKDEPAGRAVKGAAGRWWPAMKRRARALANV